MSASPPEYPILFFSDEASWAAWLSEHHAAEAGVWLRIAKAASPLQSISIVEALDVALCYGWIDGQRKSNDEDTYLQKFTPRRSRSGWSKRNRDHVARLIESGAMQEPGLAAIRAAKADGRWDRAYDSPANATIPEDFAAALSQHPEAEAFFNTLTGSNRYAFLYRIQTAVKPETRARRIAKFVDVLRRKETL